MGDLQVRGFAGLFVSNRRHACYFLKGGQRALVQYCSASWQLGSSLSWKCLRGAGARVCGT